MNKTIRISAALVLRPNGDTLLVRKTGTQVFMQPGGKIEPGETPVAALVRELREEIGVEAEAAGFVPLEHFEAPAANEPGHVVKADVFVLQIGDVPLHPSAEIEEVRWISPEAPGNIRMATLTEHHILPFYRQAVRVQRD